MTLNKKKTIQNNRQIVNQSVKVTVKLDQGALKKRRKVKRKSGKKLKKAKEILKKAFELYNEAKKQLIESNKKIPDDLMVDIDSTKLKTFAQINELSQDLVSKTQRLRTLLEIPKRQEDFVSSDFPIVIGQQQQQVNPLGRAAFVTGVLPQNQPQNQPQNNNLSDQEVEEVLAQANNGMSEYIRQIKLAKDNKPKLMSFVTDITSKRLKPSITPYEKEQLDEAYALAIELLNNLGGQIDPTLPENYSSNLATLQGLDGPVVPLPIENTEIENDVGTYVTLLKDAFFTEDFEKQASIYNDLDQILTKYKDNSANFERAVIRYMSTTFTSSQLDEIASPQQIPEYKINNMDKTTKIRILFNYFNDKNLKLFGSIDPIE